MIKEREFGKSPEAFNLQTIDLCCIMNNINFHSCFLIKEEQFCKILLTSTKHKSFGFIVFKIKDRFHKSLKKNKIKVL